jgi:hypothetical protein
VLAPVSWPGSFAIRPHCRFCLACVPTAQPFSAAIAQRDRAISDWITPSSARLPPSQARGAERNSRDATPYRTDVAAHRTAIPP